MMNELMRRPLNDPYSPKSSPRGSRSPVVSRQDSSGTLKTTIALGKTPTIVHSGPFYLMKEPPAESELTGATNLLSHYNLEHAYNKFCCGKRMKDKLSAFLPNLPGNIDTSGTSDSSSLQSLIDKPPVCNKELLPLTTSQLSGFRLHPGPLPEQYRLMNQAAAKRKHKHKKHKHKTGDLMPSEVQVTEVMEVSATPGHEKKHKKQKKHDEDKDRKKKKKEKKKKKQKHSPEANVPPNSALGATSSHLNPS